MRELEMKSRPFPAPVPQRIPVPMPLFPESRLRARINSFELQVIALSFLSWDQKVGH